MPYLKLESVKDSLLGKSKAIEISGTDLAKGTSWTKKFFRNATTKTDDGSPGELLVDLIQEFEVGDELNVVMEQDPKNAKFWNIVDFRVMEEGDKVKLESKQNFTKGGGGGSYKKADGGSRGDDTNRSAAIYLAREIVNMAGGNYTAEQIAVECIRIASGYIYPYIKDGITLEDVSELAPTPEPVSAPRGRLIPPKV